MKMLYLLTFLILLFSCGQQHKDSVAATQQNGPSYEIQAKKTGVFDTINLIDANGLKQGIWIEKNEHGSSDTLIYKDNVVQKIIWKVPEEGKHQIIVKEPETENQKQPLKIK